MKSLPFRTVLPIAFSILGLLILPPDGHAQSPEDSSPSPEKVAKATDFSIPNAPAFSLLDASPSNVHTPAYPRDFNVDWVLNDNQLASNIAIQIAPVWIFGFENVSASDYRDLNPVVRQLSSLDISVATTEESNARFLTAAAKLTLFNAADPLGDAEYTTALSNAIRLPNEQTRIQNQLDALAFEAEADTTYTPEQLNAISGLTSEAQTFGDFAPEQVESYAGLSSAEKRELRSLVEQVKTLHQELQAITDGIETRLRRTKRQYEREHWNAARVDVAGGRVLQYNSPQLDSLTLASTGWGGWINAASGLGTERVLATGMARAVTAETALDATQMRYFLGVNLRYRYGSSLNNAFVEYIRRFGDRPSRHEFAYGGSVTLTDRLNVQFGLRTSFNDDLALRALRPTIKLNGKATDLLGAL